MRSTTFRIEGMHCDGCARTIQSLVAAEPGVHAAAVSLKDGEARVLYDFEATSEDRLAAAIERAGYRVVYRSP